MNEQRDPADVLSALVGDLAAQARGEATGLTERLARIGARRTERLSAAQQRLAATLGEDHPRVAALRERRTVLEQVAAGAQQAGARQRARPKRQAQEWVAQGRVVDEQGRPLPGLRVRVADRERQLVEVLGDTETDADGAFRLAYHRRVFGEEPPELLLAVEDPGGETLASSPSALRPAAERTDVFQIVVPVERGPKATGA